MVIHEDGTPVAAGSGEVGMVALRGCNPVGYYKDPEPLSNHERAPISTLRPSPPT